MRPMIASVVVIAAAGAPAQGGPQKRIALVIGNSAYTSNPLPNCRDPRSSHGCRPEAPPGLITVVTSHSALRK